MVARQQVEASFFTFHSSLFTSSSRGFGRVTFRRNEQLKNTGIVYWRSRNKRGQKSKEYRARNIEVRSKGISVSRRFLQLFTFHFHFLVPCSLFGNQYSGTPGRGQKTLHYQWPFSTAGINPHICFPKQ
mgnify:CR=1 FL=1